MKIKKCNFFLKILSMNKKKDFKTIKFKFNK